MMGIGITWQIRRNSHTLKFLAKESRITKYVNRRPVELARSNKPQKTYRQCSY